MSNSKSVKHYQACVQDLSKIGSVHRIVGSDARAVMDRALGLVPDGTRREVGAYFSKYVESPALLEEQALQMDRGTFGDGAGIFASLCTIHEIV